MFIAEVVNVNENLLDPKTQKLRPDKANLLLYSQGFYSVFEKCIDKFVKKVQKSKQKLIKNYENYEKKRYIQFKIYYLFI